MQAENFSPSAALTRIEIWNWPRPLAPGGPNGLAPEPESLCVVVVTAGRGGVREIRNPRRVPTAAAARREQREGGDRDAEVSMMGRR